jgi:hypothetical protein
MGPQGFETRTHALKGCVQLALQRPAMSGSRLSRWKELAKTLCCGLNCGLGVHAPESQPMRCPESCLAGQNELVCYSSRHFAP